MAENGQFRADLGSTQSLSWPNSILDFAMPLPNAGENVKVTLMSGETIEGSVEWIDGDGAMIKGAQKSRWVPLEAFQPQQQIDDSKGSE